MKFVVYYVNIEMIPTEFNFIQWMN